MRYIFFLLVCVTFACNVQNGVQTNIIYRAQNNFYGVKSSAGKLLIDTIYQMIRISSDFEKPILPPKQNRENLKPLEYYLVTNVSNETAIFDKNGERIFDFIQCESIILDLHTSTAAVLKRNNANHRRSAYLHTMHGKQIMEDEFENIGYVSNSDLIALIASDGQYKEYYLFNPFENTKLGPFDNFNFYNKDMSMFGMEKSDYDKFHSLNLIKVRSELDNDYIWGIVDTKGHEVLPMVFRNLNMLSNQDLNHPALKKASKPEGVEFYFRGTHVKDPKTSIYFDRNFEQYTFISNVSTGEYRFEKIGL